MKLLGCLALLVFAKVSFGQDDMLAELEAELEAEVNFVRATWKSPVLINTYTTEIERKGVLDFRIAHRFGNVGGASGGGHSLYGLDQASHWRCQPLWFRV